MNIYQKLGIEKGIKKGIGIGAAAIVQKFSEHLSTEQIANILDMSIDKWKLI